MSTSLTFRAVGTTDNNTSGALLSPGAPAGVVVGDQLFAFTGQRTVGVTVADPSGWELLSTADASLPGLKIYSRVADGTATDTPTFDWSGSTGCFAFIAAFSGDVYPGSQKTLVTNIVPTLFVSASTLTLPALGVSGTDRLVMLLTMKNKSATSNDATTVTPPTGYTLRNSFIGAGNSVVMGFFTLQETSAVDFDGTDATVNGTAESSTSIGVALAIRTGPTVSKIIPDAVTTHNRTDTTSPQTFSHAGAASGVNIVTLEIMHGTSATDHVSAASYGGVAMTRQQRNTDTVTELGAGEVWTLLSGIPQGTQTVSYTPGSTTDDIQAVCQTFLAPGNGIVADKDGVDENVSGPSVTMQVNGRDALAVAALASGVADLSLATLLWNEDMILVSGTDYGVFTSAAFRQTVSSPVDTAIGLGTFDDTALAVVSLTYKVPANRARMPGGLSGVARRRF